MFSKSAVVGLVAGCIAAAGGGAYLAVRQSAAPPRAETASPVSAPAQPSEAARPVAETEAVVSGDGAQKASQPTAEAPLATPERSASSSAEASKSAASKSEDAVKVERDTPRVAVTPRPRPTTPAPNRGNRHPVPARAEATQPAAPLVGERHDATDAPAPVTAPPASRDIAEAPRPETPPGRQFDELLVPASSVVGLRVETPISTERAHLEDRVNARVTRDVMADGRVAIPAGAQAIGSVTLVERGGKLKERARLGVRFHTLVLADGTELPINTEAIYREGEPPAGDSTRKIGGAAVGGAILGALIGGKKGAIVGATTGAAGGTAVVMAGDRNAATLPTGTVVTVRLAAPVTVEVEKRGQPTHELCRLHS